MFTGLHQENMVLRLREEEREEFLKLSGAQPFEPMPGRKMREDVVVPPRMLDDRDTLRWWVGRAFVYGVALPPKEKEKKQ